MTKQAPDQERAARGRFSAKSSANSARADSPWSRVIAGYLLEEKIGEGGMAVVYRARDEQLDRPDLVLAGAISSSRAQKAAQHRQVRRVSEPEPIKLPRLEPADDVMLFWLAVRHGPPPAPRDPHRQIQTGLRDDPVQHGAAIDALKLSPQLLGHLPPERILGPLARLDMTTREVPHIRKPPPAR